MKELLTNYGPLFTLWFDVPQEFDEARGQGVINMARTLQPDIVINNRSGAPGDYRHARAVRAHRPGTPATGRRA